MTLGLTNGADPVDVSRKTEPRETRAKVEKQAFAERI